MQYSCIQFYYFIEDRQVERDTEVGDAPYRRVARDTEVGDAPYRRVARDTGVGDAPYRV